jgi:hypothetical protein
VSITEQKDDVIKNDAPQGTAVAEGAR